jgi:hypothetical protein
MFSARHCDELNDSKRGSRNNAELRSLSKRGGVGRIQPVGRHIAHVDTGRWPLRDPRAVSESATGIK